MKSWVARHLGTGTTRRGDLDIGPPAACAGESAVMLVAVGVPTMVPATVPKSTEVTPRKLAPGDGDGGAPSGPARGGRNLGDRGHTLIGERLVARPWGMVMTRRGDLDIVLAGRLRR